MIKILTTLVAVFIPFSTALALPTDILDLSRFKQQVEFQAEGITTPKVIRLQSKIPLQGHGVLFEIQDGGDINPVHSAVLPSRVIRSYEKRTTLPNVQISSVSSQFLGEKNNMIDGDPKTGLTFDSLQTNHSFEITFPELTDINSIHFIHGDGDIMAKKVSVDALFENNEWRPVVKSEKYRTYMTWPQIQVQALKFTFQTPHLFRINEIYFSGTQETERVDELILYAKEGQKYLYFFDPTFGQKSYPSKQTQPLETDKVTPVFDLPVPKESRFYNDDFDGDGITDEEDLCPKTKDKKNADRDKNGRGDVCEDLDQDNRIASEDNCPTVHNPLQQDSDLDGIGDICDTNNDSLTENVDYLLYVVFGLAILVLGGLMWRSMRK